MQHFGYFCSICSNVRPFFPAEVSMCRKGKEWTAIIIIVGGRVQYVPIFPNKMKAVAGKIGSSSFFMEKFTSQHCTFWQTDSLWMASFLNQKRINSRKGCLAWLVPTLQWFPWEVVDCWVKSLFSGFFLACQRFGTKPWCISYLHKDISVVVSFPGCFPWAIFNKKLLFFVWFFERKFRPTKKIGLKGSFLFYG